MSKQSLDPQRISKNVWYYEEGRHFTFVVYAKEFPADHNGIIQFAVPLRMLEVSLARSPRAKKVSGQGPGRQRRQRVRA